MSLTRFVTSGGDQQVSTNSECQSASIPTYKPDGTLPILAPNRASSGLGSVTTYLNFLDAQNDDSLGGAVDGTGSVAAVNQVWASPFVDSTGSGTFKYALGDGPATAAITYSATAATLVTNINAAFDTAYGASELVASGATLTAIIVTASGNRYSARDAGRLIANVVTGSTGYTINASSTANAPSICPVSTQGVAANTAGRFKRVQTTGTSSLLRTQGATNTTITSKAIFELQIPEYYKTGDNISVIVDALHTLNGGTVGTHTVMADVYLMTAAGLSGASITSSTATSTTTSAADYTFNVNGSTLTPGARIQVRLMAVIQETGNAGTGTTIDINSLRVA